MFSPGTTFKTSGDPEISDEKKFIQNLQGKTLEDLEEQKCSKYTAPAKKLFLTVGKVQRNALFSSDTSKKVGSEAGNNANTVDNLYVCILLH